MSKFLDYEGLKTYHNAFNDKVVLKSGGTMTGHLIVNHWVTSNESDSTTAAFQVIGKGNHIGRLTVDTSDRFGLYDAHHNKYLIVCNPDGTVTSYATNKVSTTGDTMTGELIVSKENPSIVVKTPTDTRRISLTIASNNSAGIWDGTNGKWMLYATPEGNAQFQGNATTASTLQTPRNIAGVAFNGSKDIELDATKIQNAVWAAGNTVTTTGGIFQAYGHIMASRLQCRITILMGKPITASNCNVTALAGYIYGPSGYVNNASTVTNFVSGSGYSVSASIHNNTKSLGVVQITISKSDGFTNVTDGSSVIAEITGFSITFS